MTETQAKAARPPGLLRKIFLNVLYFLLVATMVGCATRLLISLTNHDPGPAGFARGVVHGALMPCALPNLLVRNDVMIYAPNNTGRMYKLGYTVGVNSCGLIFFGFFFWRIQNWRKRIKGAENRG